MRICAGAWFWCTLAFGALCCTPSDAERCGDGYTYDSDDCWPIDTDPGDAGMDSGGTDAGEDGGADAGHVPTGLNEPCTGPDHEDCAQFEADYCASDPMNDYKGICTVKDCTTVPDNCPLDWRCCRFPEMFQMPNFCMSTEDYQEQFEAGICLD